MERCFALHIALPAFPFVTLSQLRCRATAVGVAARTWALCAPNGGHLCPLSSRKKNLVVLPPPICFLCACGCWDPQFVSFCTFLAGVPLLRPWHTFRATAMCKSLVLLTWACVGAHLRTQTFFRWCWCDCGDGDGEK